MSKYDLTTWQSLKYGHGLKQEQKKEITKIDNKIKSLEETDLKEVKFLGEEAILKLFENGYYSIEDVKNAGIEKINKIDLPFFSKRGIKLIFK